MCDEQGQLVGGTSSNVFIVSGGRLLTPAITHAGISGVMRRVILQQACVSAIESHEVSLTKADVLAADEVFVSNALTGIRPVRQIDEHQWKPGPVSCELAARLATNGVDECAGSC